jgi:hypothetical protein
MLIRTPNSASECDLNNVLQPFLNIIPDTLDSQQKRRRQDFTRIRKLPVNKVILSTISLVGNGNTNGTATHLGHLFRNARRSGLWPDAQAVHPSALSKARKKVPWEVFQTTLHDAVDLAYDLWPDDPQYTWNGLSVYTVDGSKFMLPATETIRKAFDPDSGLEHVGKGHYPQCLVSTLYDVFRRLPVARTIVSSHGSERDEAVALLPHVPTTSVLLFDRGYPSYDLFRRLTTVDRQFFIFRCAATCTFPAVEAFVKSGKADATIWITPSNKALARLSPRHRKQLKAIKVRVILLQHPDGTVSVLITNLLNRARYSRQDIVDLYFRRWAVENYYKDEKVTLQIETFHSQTPNGIRQELFAAMIMTVIARTLMLIAQQRYVKDQHLCQCKHAILTLAAEAAILIPETPEQALVIFTELLQEIARVKYYPPATPRSSQPRINKHPINKWSKRNRKTTP